VFWINTRTIWPEAFCERVVVVGSIQRLRGL
jgi:hypothetical protein